MRAVVFAGPSLPPSLRPTDPALEWLPPVRQGEVYRAALSRPDVIAIVDGYFEATPTAWHKEMLWAMTQGIHLFGAASIGALRAAELGAFGMRGIGCIYRDFRDGVLDDDDEVAVLHGPEELGYLPLTEAMVNIRATLAAAVRDGVVDQTLAAEFAGLAKTLFYKERTYPVVFDAAAASGLPAVELNRLKHWLPAGRVDQKRRDALAMVDVVIAHMAAGPPPLRVSYALAETAAWQVVKRQI
jgi:hypothetical protein